MATAASQELYPLSTNDAKSIPLDIIRPKSLMHILVAEEAETAVVIPADFDTVVMYATVDMVLDFDDLATYPLGSSTLASAVFLPAQTMMTVSCPSTGDARLIPVRAAESGFCIIQSVQKWAGLGLQRQLANR